MTEKAKQFLVELSKDPVKMEDFWKDPDAFLVSADLTAEEKDILRSGDYDRLQELLGPLQLSWHEIPRPVPHKPRPKPKSEPRPKPKRHRE